MHLDQSERFPDEMEVRLEALPDTRDEAARHLVESRDCHDVAHSFEDAYRTAIALACEMPRLPETTRLLALLPGRVLARAVCARHAVPIGNEAQFDGYAVQSRDLVGNAPWSFRICGELAAGQALSGEIIHRKSAIRVAAGAHLLPPFDTVVPLDQVARTAAKITISGIPAAPGFQPKASVYSDGQVVLTPGRLMTPRDIGAIAAAGYTEAPVLRKLRVAMISVGEGLNESCTTPGSRDVNRPMIEAQLTRKWIELRDFGVVADGVDTLRLTLDMAAGWADVILTTGGTSGGCEGRVARALSLLDAETRVPGIRMSPGGASRIGRIGSALFVAMPGAPVAVQTVLITLVQAILAHRIGLPDLSTGFQRGVSAKAAESAAGCTEFRLVQVDGHDDSGPPTLRFPDLKGDGDVSALVSASGIARIAPAATSVDAGEELIWFPFADCAI